MKKIDVTWRVNGKRGNFHLELFRQVELPIVPRQGDMITLGSRTWKLKDTHSIWLRPGYNVEMYLRNTPDLVEENRFFSWLQDVLQDGWILREGNAFFEDLIWREGCWCHDEEKADKRRSMII